VEEETPRDEGRGAADREDKASSLDPLFCLGAKEYIFFAVSLDIDVRCLFWPQQLFSFPLNLDCYFECHNVIIISPFCGNPHNRASEMAHQNLVCCVLTADIALWFCGRCLGMWHVRSAKNIWPSAGFEL
jgi:hypothetical protein